MSMETHREYVGYLDEWDGTERLTDEEIVRCRDCKHATKNGTRCYHFMTLDCWENPVPSEVNPNGFCAWGERK